MNLILLGAPGAGKGTLASYLIEQMGVPSISTGNILREAIKNNTPLGQSAKEYMDAGKLVPDEVVIGMLKERTLSATARAVSSSTVFRVRFRRRKHSTRLLTSTALCPLKLQTTSSKSA